MGTLLPDSADFVHVSSFSNYWTAVLFFKARNGSLHRVPTFANQYLEPANGGITVYYIPPYDGKTMVTAFQKVRWRMGFLARADRPPGIPHDRWGSNKALLRWR